MTHLAQGDHSFLSELPANTLRFAVTLPLVGNGVDCWVCSKRKRRRIGIASDVVRVEGEDPATPGCLREVRVRWCVGDFQSWVRALLARSASRNPGTVH